MSKADNFKIIDRNGMAAPWPESDVIAAAAVRAISCLQELRRASQDDSLERMKKVEAEADHIIKSAGFSL